MCEHQILSKEWSVCQTDLGQTYRLRVKQCSKRNFPGLENNHRLNHEPKLLYNIEEQTQKYSICKTMPKNGIFSEVKSPSKGFFWRGPRTYTYIHTYTHTPSGRLKTFNACQMSVSERFTAPTAQQTSCSPPQAIWVMEGRGGSGCPAKALFYTHGSLDSPEELVHVLAGRPAPVDVERPGVDLGSVPVWIHFNPRLQESDQR